jgi:pilus assembly protein CpaB
MARHKPVLLLTVAVAIALVTSFTTYNWLQEKAMAREVGPVETEMVAVTVSDVTWGTVLQPEMVRLEPFLRESLPRGKYFSDLTRLVGRVVVSPLQAGEPVFASRLAPESVSEGGVSALLETNRRAMAVKVNKVIGVSGFIKPGHKVDVLVTLTKAGKKNTTVTKIVLEDVLVLAAGTEMEKDGKGSQTKPVDVITLEVTPEEAEKLALATSEGKIQLALRGYTDTSDVLTRGATINSLLASYNGAETEPAPRKAREPVVHRTPSNPAYTVWVINGGEVKGQQVEGR